MYLEEQRSERTDAKRQRQFSLTAAETQKRKSHQGFICKSISEEN